MSPNPGPAREAADVERPASEASSRKPTEPLPDP